MAARSVRFAPGLATAATAAGGGGGTATSLRNSDGDQEEVLSPRRGEGGAAGGGDEGDSSGDEDDRKMPAKVIAASTTAEPSTASTTPGGSTFSTPAAGASAAAQVSRHPELICPNCGSQEIEQPHDASGASICMVCGVVVEENAIVSAVEFVEGAGGSSSMIGQFVSATSSKAYTGGGAGGGIRGGAGRYGFSRDSREATLAHGRRRIQDIASRLRLGSHFVDSAHRLFTIAVEKNFVQGRRTAHVVAACLYIACRQEKSQHMLIDFSDALQTNVFTLGTCFLKFRRLLGLKLEIIDPALYVYRFAAHLHLNDKANAVALTALRLVGRMKRDWITAGRRPAGICAGALLIAARAHGFDKHHSDVTRVLRVCGLTVSSRVREFERTPSARLTLDEFTSVDLDAEADPPVFQRNRFREARARAIAGGDVELLASGALDDPGGGKRASSWREPDRQRKNSGKTKLNMLYSSIDRELKGAAENRQLQKDDPPQESSIKAPPELADAATAATPAPTTTTTENSKGEGQVVPVVGTLDLSKIPDKWRRVFPKSNKGLTLVLPEQATDEERQAPTVPVELKIDLQDWKRDLPKEVAEEIDSIFVTEEEERQKEVIFNRINKDYLELQARKERDRQSAEAANERREREDAAQSEDHARFYNKMMSRRKRGAPLTDDATKTTEEHLMESIATRKVSRRINYEALSSIFGEDGSFATTDAIGNDGDDIDGDSERADAAGGGGDDDDRAIGAGEDPMFAQL